MVRASRPVGHNLPRRSVPLQTFAKREHPRMPPKTAMHASGRGQSRVVTAPQYRSGRFLAREHRVAALVGDPILFVRARFSRVVLINQSNRHVTDWLTAIIN